MKTPKLLTEEILNDHIKTMSNINMEICKVIESITDEEGEPLYFINTNFVEGLRDIAYSVYKNSELIEEDKYEIMNQFEEYANR
jgi:hypothetical protein